MNIWVVSREYAGIAEAGGVKNVSCSLSESLVRLGHNVTLFIPLYGCTDLSEVENFSCFWKKPVTLDLPGGSVTVSFAHGIMKGVNIVLVCHKSFSVKRAVYTYTSEDEEENPAHRKGHGHEDVNFLNTLFQKAVACYGSLCQFEERPEVIHSQDAACAMVSVYVDSLRNSDSVFARAYKNTKFCVTIHNAGPGYHHQFNSLEEARNFTGLPDSILEKGLNGGCVEPFLLAALCSAVTTVSPEYAMEIAESKTDTAGLSEGYGRLGTRIIGITNGIDFERYNPSDTRKSLLPYAFNPRVRDLEGKYECRRVFLKEFASRERAGTRYNVDAKDPTNFLEQYGWLDEGDDSQLVYISYHGRVVYQKGIDVMAEASEKLLAVDPDVRFIFAGQGSIEQENALKNLAEKYAGKCVYLKGYDRYEARLCVAAGDFSLHPSYFEPCGLEDFIAQSFGTIPVAHATGGLCKIIDDETGFLYKPNTGSELGKTLLSIVQIMHSAGRGIFKPMISYASKYVHQTYSWDKVAFQYEKLYSEI